MRNFLIFFLLLGAPVFCQADSLITDFVSSLFQKNPTVKSVESKFSKGDLVALVTQDKAPYVGFYNFLGFKKSISPLYKVFGGFEEKDNPLLLSHTDSKPLPGLSPLFSYKVDEFVPTKEVPQETISNNLLKASGCSEKGFCVGDYVYFYYLRKTESKVRVKSGYLIAFQPGDEKVFMFSDDTKNSIYFGRPLKLTRSPCHVYSDCQGESIFFGNDFESLNYAIEVVRGKIIEKIFDVGCLDNTNNSKSLFLVVSEFNQIEILGTGCVELNDMFAIDSDIHAILENHSDSLRRGEAIYYRRSIDPLDVWYNRATVRHVGRNYILSQDSNDSEHIFFVSKENVATHLKCLGTSFCINDIVSLNNLNSNFYVIVAFTKDLNSAILKQELENTSIYFEVSLRDIKTLEPIGGRNE